MTEIRKAKARDLTRVLSIEAESFGRDAWDRPIFVRALEESPHLFLVARSVKRRKRSLTLAARQRLPSRPVVGYSITYVERGAGELVSIAVAPLYRGKGVGEALVRFTIGELSKRGIDVMRLVVRVDNDWALAFYKRLGFVRIRRVKGYYGRGQDGWRMEKGGS